MTGSAKPQSWYGPAHHNYDGRTDLNVIQDGPLTAARYRDEILHSFVRAYAWADEQSFVLIDDNARSHRGRVVQRYFEEQGVERMDWPERSPDLNPIEHAWDMLQRRISLKDRRPETAEELAKLSTEEWRQIPRAESCRGLFAVSKTGVGK